MSTKWGVTALIVGGYLVALGIAGINADSGGTVAVFAVVLVVGFVMAGWAVLLPWDRGKAPHTVHDPGGPAALESGDSVEAAHSMERG